MLGWCNDFSELVDSIEYTGHEGCLFTTTRDQGLQTCEEILQMDLDVKLQLVILYLRYDSIPCSAGGTLNNLGNSTQICRLRRFLDGDGSDDQDS